MSEHKSGTVLPPHQAVIPRTFGIEGVLVETLPFMLVPDAIGDEENRQTNGIKATAHSIKIVKQLIDYIKTL
jgi:hypothetical protein